MGRSLAPAWGRVLLRTRLPASHVVPMRSIQPWGSDAGRCSGHSPPHRAAHSTSCLSRPTMITGVRGGGFMRRGWPRGPAERARTPAIAGKQAGGHKPRSGELWALKATATAGDGVTPPTVRRSRRGACCVLEAAYARSSLTLRAVLRQLARQLEPNAAVGARHEGDLRGVPVGRAGRCGRPMAGWRRRRRLRQVGARPRRRRARRLASGRRPRTERLTGCPRPPCPSGLAHPGASSRPGAP